MDPNPTRRTVLHAVRFSFKEMKMLRLTTRVLAAVGLCLAVNVNANANAAVNLTAEPSAASLTWPTPWCPPFMPRQFCPK
jgi:hypothetical protein